MKKLMIALTGILMSVSLAACAPTDTSGQNQDKQAAEGQTVEASIPETEREVVEKLPDADAAPMAQVSMFTVKENRTGLKQSMDAIDSEDGETIDPQLLADKMAENGILEEGTKVLSFSQEGSVISVDLSAMPNQDDVLQQTAVANTLLQNFEASELNLSVNGEKLGTMEFNKGYKIFDNLFVFPDTQGLQEHRKRDLCGRDRKRERSRKRRGDGRKLPGNRGRITETRREGGHHPFFFTSISINVT